MRKAFVVSAALMIGMLLNGSSAQGQKTQAVNGTLELRPVIVQGAMDLEVKKLASRLHNVRVEKVSGWTFWRGTLDGYPVIVSKTMKGVSNSAAPRRLRLNAIIRWRSSTSSRSQRQPAVARLPGSAA
jgi:adenosylhomocysteine nucleosidase